MRPDSPAARAGLKAGDVINSMTIKPSKSAKTSDGKPAASERAATLNFDDGSLDWINAFGRLQIQRDIDIELIVNKASQATRITPEPDRRLAVPAPGSGVPAAPQQDAAAAGRLGAAPRVRRYGREHPEHLRDAPQPGHAAG